MGSEEFFQCSQCERVLPINLRAVIEGLICNACALEQDHWTMPEDPNPTPQAGYKWINLNAFFKKFPELMEWHDRVTQRNSFARKVGIPNWVIVAAWKAMIEHKMKDPSMRGQGGAKMVWRLSNTFFRYAHRFWYEGPLTKGPPIIGDPPSGEMF